MKSDLRFGVGHEVPPLLGESVWALGCKIPFREYQRVGRCLADADREATFLLILPDARRSATVEGGMVIERLPCFVFGALNRRPAFVSSKERSTRTMPASRSTSCQRKANSSPRRMPVANASIAIGYNG